MVVIVNGTSPERSPGGNTLLFLLILQITGSVLRATQYIQLGNRWLLMCLFPFSVLMSSFFSNFNQDMPVPWRMLPCFSFTHVKWPKWPQIHHHTVEVFIYHFPLYPVERFLTWKWRAKSKTWTFVCQDEHCGTSCTPNTTTLCKSGGITKRPNLLPFLLCTETDSVNCWAYKNIWTPDIRLHNQSAFLFPSVLFA